MYSNTNWLQANYLSSRNRNFGTCLSGLLYKLDSDWAKQIYLLVNWMLKNYFRESSNRWNVGKKIKKRCWTEIKNIQNNADEKEILLLLLTVQFVKSFKYHPSDGYLEK
jgi:hypothetical protein